MSETPTLRQILDQHADSIEVNFADLERDVLAWHKRETARLRKLLVRSQGEHWEEWAREIAECDQLAKENGTNARGD
jgi:hypothetical protein